MHNPIVIIGIGEMAGVFARGFLRLGHPVHPITRHMDISREADTLPAPELVLVAVAEKDLQATLTNIPSAWRDRIVLLQNELLPRDWRDHGFESLSIISIWFEKKKGQDVKVLIPSPAHGPHAETLSAALQNIEIPVRVIDCDDRMLYELVRKNVYILTTNISGLEVGGTVSDLWEKHEILARNVANDVIDLQEWLTGQALPREKLVDGMLEAFDGDPKHKCMGRSAAARLQRTLSLADQAELAVPHLKEIARKHLGAP